MKRFINYEKVIHESERNGKPYCLGVACIDENQLKIVRIDFEEWELNRRDGQVEFDYIFDVPNTLRLAGLLGVSTSAQFISELMKRCPSRNFSIGFFSELKRLCKDNGIEYNYQVWY